MDKYFYVRKDSTIGNDDDNANGSNLFPLSTFRGMESTSDTTSTMYFHGRVNSFSGGEGANADYISDTIVLTHATNDHKAVYQAIVAAINGGVGSSRDGFIVLFDAVNSIALGGITAVTPAIAAAQA